MLHSALGSLRHKITLPTLKIWEKLGKEAKEKPAQEPTGEGLARTTGLEPVGG